MKAFPDLPSTSAPGILEAVLHMLAQEPNGRLLTLRFLGFPVEEPGSANWLHPGRAGTTFAIERQVERTQAVYEELVRGPVKASNEH